jgi:POT family proton-dependent oligopeptide transporter
MQENTHKPNNFFDSKVLGHPSGLFVLFFTEMWERFSYYGMRALLVLFLISAFGLGGWNWPSSHALSLYGTYTALVYITPILGGFIADKYIGYRRAVVIGAVIMTLGHASMAIETNSVFLYIGIGLLIVGNGFFKPNMTSIVSHMYKDFPEKKDGAYTIFYMGVNAGAFLGILLCGYIGENISWSYGFGLAGIFMLLGMLQFHFTQKILGDVGLKPVKTDGASNAKLEFEGDKLNPFTMFDRVLIVLSAFIGVTWVLNDPISKIGGTNLLMFNEIDYSNHYIVTGLILFFTLLTTRILRYPVVTRDRMLAIVVFAFMTVIFWMCFEQAGGSMTIFANDFTNRVMVGNYYYIYLVVNIIIIVVPVGIITWVLLKLFKQTFAKYKFGNLILSTSFIFIWGIIFWMIQRDLNSYSYVVNYDQVQTAIVPEQYNLHPDRQTKFSSMLAGGSSFVINPSTENEESIKIDSVVYNGVSIIQGHSKKEKKSEKEAEQAILDGLYTASILAIPNTQDAMVYYHEKLDVKKTPLSNLHFNTVITEETAVAAGENIVKGTVTIIEPVKLKVGDKLALMDLDKEGNIDFLTDERVKNIRKSALDGKENTNIIPAQVTLIKDKEVKIPATWFLILNSLFIIIFAPIVSKWWESKYNPSASVKYGLGLVLLGVGFGALAYGSTGIEPGAKTASVSMIWLVLAYLFHTLGELCISPVALSYVSKLVPGRMIAMMFGIWYIAVAIGNKLAGKLGGQIESITETYDMTTFFLIFTFIPIGLGLIGIAIYKVISKLMHGIK